MYSTTRRTAPMYASQVKLLGTRLTLERSAEVVTEQAGPAADERGQFGNIRACDPRTLKAVVPENVFGRIGRCRPDQSVNRVRGDVRVSAAIGMRVGAVEEE